MTTPGADTIGLTAPLFDQLGLVTSVSTTNQLRNINPSRAEALLGPHVNGDLRVKQDYFTLPLLKNNYLLPVEKLPPYGPISLTRRHMQFHQFDFNGMNETDIREEVIAPLLRELGYRSGTEDTVIREQPLSYPKSFLGRKKESDPILPGKADYICITRNQVRWVIEAKAPHAR
jgi:hypothetical protein